MRITEILPNDLVRRRSDMSLFRHDEFCGGRLGGRAVRAAIEADQYNQALPKKERGERRARRLVAR